jgi:hypothetical protein
VDLSHMTTGTSLLLIVLGLIVLWFIVREVILWYYRINEIVVLLKDIRKNLVELNSKTTKEVDISKETGDVSSAS